MELTRIPDLATRVTARREGKKPRRLDKTKGSAHTCRNGSHRATQRDGGPNMNRGIAAITILSSCLALCSCALTPADDLLDQSVNVAPLSLHQQYVVPALPASAQVFHWGASSLVEEKLSPFLNLFSPPNPPFSY